MRWTKDGEERAACVQKAHDAYALGRQALEKAAGSEARAAEALAESGELRAEMAGLRRRLAELERAVDEATMPRRVKPVVRKAA